MTRDMKCKLRKSMWGNMAICFTAGLVNLPMLWYWQIQTSAAWRVVGSSFSVVSLFACWRGAALVWMETRQTMRKLAL